MVRLDVGAHYNDLYADRMIRTSRKPKLWAILLLFALGALSIALSAYTWASSSPEELQEWSPGRGLFLPGWAWIVVGCASGLTLMVASLWAERRRRHWS
jgi:hypothetical protein